MAWLIGTAGHVDHGKTSLIRALTGIDADRLPEEKKRGLTIDIGFAYIDLPGVGKTSIVDVPGHERFLANMLVGALGVDVALLCVAADEGVMPQTQEHFQILELLPVQRLVVALTRSDLADQETREAAALEVVDMMAKTRFAGSPVLAVSAHTGEGLDELRTSLADALGQVSVPNPGPDWYLPIDRVFAIKGHGAVATGTLMRGQVREGDKGVVLPDGLEVRVRAIQWHDDPQPAAVKGMRTALNLSGAKLEELHRGQVVGASGTVFATNQLDATMRWIGPVRHGMRVRVSIGSDEVIGKAFLNDLDPEVAQFRFERPTAAASGQPLIVRRYSPPDLLGGGRVRIPQAHRWRKSEAVTEGVEQQSDEQAILAVVQSSHTGVDTEEVCRRVGKSPQALGDAFERLRLEGAILGFAGRWVTEQVCGELVDSLTQALQALHGKLPTKAFHSREVVCSEAGLNWTGKPLDRLLAKMVADGVLRASGSGIAVAGHQVSLSPRQAATLKRVLEELEQAGANVPSSAEVARGLGVPPQTVDELLRLGQEAGYVIRVAEGIFYGSAQLQRLLQNARQALGEEPFSASQFREALQTSRKYAIPLLEYLDSRRVTVRQGEVRRWATRLQDR